MAELLFRAATAEDAERVALLHADSWRRHYRGAYADAYLDGDDVAADRLAVWSSRMAAPTGTATLLAEDGGELAGFVHVVLDADPRWGSLVDNLHVAGDRRRSGVGTALLTRAARTATARAAAPGLYLWVLEQNTAAQRFYAALGGTCAERALVRPPGGDPARLNGAPAMLRIAWSDAAAVRRAVTA